MGKLYIFSLLCLISIPTFGTSVSPYIGKKKDLFQVDRILVEGVKKVEPEAILEKLLVRPGMVVDNYLIRKDIERIYGMKHFEAVEVHHRISKKKNTLIFRVQEKPVISKIIIQGNHEVDEDEIRKKIKIKEFNILDINTLKNDVLSLQKFYEEKGFFLAIIRYQMKKTKSQTVEVFFDIKEFDKVRVKKITFLGNRYLSDHKLKSYMQTKENSLFSFLGGSGSLKEFNFKTDVERIKYVYRTKGHLQVNVAAPSITVSEDKRWIFITLKIIEGPAYTINDIIFNGDTLFVENDVKGKLKLQKGGLYAEDKLREDIQFLTEFYQDRGYAFTNVLRNVQVIPGEHRVNLQFSFEKGEIVHFGKITVKGNTGTRDKVIRRELKIYEGMMYTGSKLRKSKENVIRLGFFEPGSVIFNTLSRDDQLNVLDVEIQVKERNTGQLSAGAGYSTAGGYFFQGSIAENNFRGLGQSLRFTLNYSKDIQTFQLGFLEPSLVDTDWSGGIDIFYDSNKSGIDQKIEDRGFSLRVGRSLFEFTRFFIAYKFTDTLVSDIDDPTINPEVENGVASVVEGTVIRDTRNNRYEPSEGTYMRVVAGQAGFGFDKRWRKLEWDSRFYHKIITDLVLRHRLVLGQIFEVDQEPIPRNVRFFLGGPRNMRGYAMREVGPKISFEDRPGVLFSVGGLGKLYSALELEYMLVQELRLKGVIFVDAGNVYRKKLGSYDDHFLRYDYGYGFRFFSPIGVLRFEFGHPINKQRGERGRLFSFDIGQLF